MISCTAAATGTAVPVGYEEVEQLPDGRPADARISPA